MESILILDAAVRALAFASAAFVAYGGCLALGATTRGDGLPICMFG